jgi:hypothetical protein
VAEVQEEEGDFSVIVLNVLNAPVRVRSKGVKE